MTSVPRVSPYPIIPISSALSTISASLKPLPPTLTPLSESLGLILATPVLAPHPIPAFRASIKDGYALHHASPNRTLRIAGEVVAGNDSLPSFSQEEAVYVTTGAPVPDDADVVVMVEHTEPVDDHHIRVTKWPREAGTDIRDVGFDMKIGETVLDAGVTIGPAEVGLLGSCGIRMVETIRRVVVGVFSSGDELVEVGEGVDEQGNMKLGAVVDSNRPMLLACMNKYLPSCEAVDLGIIKDTYEAVKEGIVSAFNKCDMVVTSGGVSMGKRDVIKNVLEEIGTVHFGRVLMKPGKPLTFATVGEKAVIGLPGNPVSAFVCFQLTVSLAAKTLAGWGDRAHGDVVEATLQDEIKCDGQRPEYHRATIKVSTTCPNFSIPVPSTTEERFTNNCCPTCVCSSRISGSKVRDTSHSRPVSRQAPAYFRPDPQTLCS